MHVQTSMSTVTLNPAGKRLPVDCTVRRRQLQWRKYDPISVLEVGSLSGCGVWCRCIAISSVTVPRLQEKGEQWPGTYRMHMSQHFPVKM